MEMKEDNWEPPEIIIKPGVNAYPLPYLGNPYKHEEQNNLPLPTIAELDSRVNNVLAEINRQGGQIIGIIPVELAGEYEEGHQHKILVRTYIIIRR